jgi:Fic family protein
MSTKAKNDAMPRLSDRPYNDLPKLPPSGVELDSKPVLLRCIRARAALARLDQATDLIPNPAILINTLPVLEARASTEIENIVTTNDELFRYQESDDHDDPATKEALRYRHALLEGFGSLKGRPLVTATAEAICTRIKGVDMRVRRVPGTRLENGAGEAIYTPPEGEEQLRDLLANWERFLHEEEYLDPLIRLAVGHYQFEAIHPFTDGNGRTGRVLNNLFLIETGLLRSPILYLSRFIIQHKADYYRLLLGVTADGAWDEWILYLLKGIEETALWTLAKLQAMRQLFDATAQYVREQRPKIYSHELVEAIFAQPYSRIRNLVDADIVGRQAASRYLKELVEIGVLHEQKVGREVLFLNHRLLALLTGEDNNVPAFK